MERGKPDGATPEFEAAVLSAIEQYYSREIDLPSAMWKVIFARAEMGWPFRKEDDDWAREILLLNNALRTHWQLWEEDRCNPIFLEAAPARELFLPNPAVHESVDWEDRWRGVNGFIVEKRMVALKSDPIWQMISSFGYPFPPFASCSRMSIREVRRSEAFRLGLMESHSIIELSEFPRPGRVFWL